MMEPHIGHPTRLLGGDWGVWIDKPVEQVEIDDEVQVVARNGREWTAWIDDRWAGDEEDMTIATTRNFQ